MEGVTVNQHVRLMLANITAVCETLLENLDMEATFFLQSPQGTWYLKRTQIILFFF